MRFRLFLTLISTTVFCPILRGGDLSQPGPFFAGSTTVTIRRPDASTFSALLYYPATAEGTDTPLNASAAPFSAVAFGHGFLQQPSRYFGTLGHLATYGHLVIAANSQTGFFPSHSDFAADMRLTLDYLVARNAEPGDTLFGLVDPNRFGLFGHSMGGGAGLLATAEDPRIKAFAGLATAITNPSPEPLMPQISAPVALLSGDEDGIVDYTTATVPLYNAATAPRLRPLITGGCHVGFQDDPFPLFPDSGSLPPEEQLALTRFYLTSYFGLYLRDDQTLWRNVWGPEAFSLPGLPTEIDSGIDVASDPLRQTAVAGQIATFQITVTNTGPSATGLMLFAEDNAWETVLSVQETPVLAPAGQFQFNVEITVPAEVPVGVSDTVLLSARSINDGGTRGYTILTVEAVPEQIPGDANGDGNVDDEDAVALAAHWGQSGGWTEGDFNDDGLVGPADASILAANWGYGTSEKTSVPEPISVLMLLQGLLLVLCRQRRKQ